MLRAGFVVLTISGLSLGANHARADALPLKTGIKLGKPARQLEVNVVERDGLVAELGGASLVIPAKGVTSATVESIAVAEDAAVAVLRASASNGEWVAVLGGRAGKELLLAERSDLRGDPGERRSTVVEVKPEGAFSTLRVGTQFEGVAPCGATQPWLVASKALDPKTLKLVPSPAVTAPAGAVAQAEVTAQSSDAPSPAVRGLSAASSSQVDELTSTLHVPHALVDGRVETSWQAAPGDAALLRWSTPALGLEGFDVRISGRGAKGGPLSLLVLLESGAVRATVPAAEGVDRFRIKLPAKQNSSCVTLLLESAESKPGSPKQALQLAELSAVTELDAPGAMERLVSDLVQDGERGALAAELLAQLGGQAAQRVAQRFDELSPRARRRALKVLAPALSAPEVRARVLEAARSSDEHLSSAALSVLASGREPGRVGLRELVLNNDAAGDAAARGLASSAPSETAALLAALAQAGGPDRLALRRALVSVARRDREAFGVAAQSWLAAGPSIAARVGLVVVAADADLLDIATSTAEGALPEASEFVERFRLASHAAQLKASVAVDEWLTKQSTQAEEWMARRAAYDALVARNEAAARALATGVARDAYPRVRAGAVPELARAGNTQLVSTIARKDSWPLVRAAAASALGALPDTRPTLEQLLDDTSRKVRSAAIDALVTQQASSAWPLVEQRLTAPAEWPEVQAAAVRFAAALCVQDARPPLTHVARRSLRPDATDDERRLGLEAIHALHDLGGEAAKDAQLLATRESGSAELAQALARFGPPRCPSVPH